MSEICGARTRDGDGCKRWSLAGRKRCRRHGSALGGYRGGPIYQARAVTVLRQAAFREAGIPWYGGRPRSMRRRVIEAMARMRAEHEARKGELERRLAIGPAADASGAVDVNDGDNRAQRLEELVGQSLDVIEANLAIEIPDTRTSKGKARYKAETALEYVRLLRLKQDAALSIIATQAKVDADRLRVHQEQAQLAVIVRALEEAKKEL